jgi:large subunit ribosomal protein L15
MQLHELVPATKRKVAKRIGLGGKRGKTSGRGGKGQTARTGNSTRPEMRDIIKKLPKLRGHGKNRADTVNNEQVPVMPINLSVIEANFAAGETVSPRSLVTKKLVNTRRKRVPVVKILGTGTLTKKVTIEGCMISATAEAAVIAAGGKVTK